MSKAIIAFLAAGIACVVAGVIVGKRLYFDSSAFEPEEDIDEPANDTPTEPDAKTESEQQTTNSDTTLDELDA